MTAVSISSPAMRIERLTTMPASEMTATSVVPPPMSTTIEAWGSVIGTQFDPMLAKAVPGLPEGDGWEKLCGFLGYPVPAKPFPHANKASLSRKFKNWLQSKTS